MEIHGKRTAPDGIEVRHPAFYVTPNELVTAIITQKGIARPPYTETLRKLSGLQQCAGGSPAKYVSEQSSLTRVPN